MSTETTSSEVRGYWRILLAAMIGTGCGLLSITFYTQGLFFQPVTAEFGWTRAEFFTSYVILMLGRYPESASFSRSAEAP